MQPNEIAALDPGIRAVVLRVREAGFITTDSGDGVSKPADWYYSGDAIPFPHVVAATTPETMVEDAERLAEVLGPGWNVEAQYQTSMRQAHLFARTLHPAERDEAEALAAAVRDVAAGRIRPLSDIDAELGRRHSLPPYPDGQVS